MKKSDLILLISLVSLSLLALLILFAFFGNSGEVAVVTVNGEEVARLPLAENAELLIEGTDGTNRLVIRNGKAFMTEATCPDKICVHTGEASTLRSIVCVPNRVVITIESE